MNAIRVISSSIIEEHVKNPLSRLQKIICKLFKITPSNEYWYLIKIGIGLPHPIRMHDVIVDRFGNSWMVVDVVGKFIYVKNLKPNLCYGIYGYIMYSYSCFSV